MGEHVSKFVQIPDCLPYPVVGLNVGTASPCNGQDLHKGKSCPLKRCGMWENSREIGAQKFLEK